MRKLIVALTGILLFVAVFAAAQSTYYERVRQPNYRFMKYTAHQPKAVSLTSPTVTFDVNDTSYVTLNSDANQTGVRPLKGSTGQVLYIVSGAGSNTMRFDDSGTTMALGGNITLTEGQGDALLLICTSQSTNSWSRVSTGDN